jgi:hypothetical protein
MADHVPSSNAGLVLLWAIFPVLRGILEVTFSGGKSSRECREPQDEKESKATSRSDSHYKKRFSELSLTKRSQSVDAPVIWFARYLICVFFET